MPIPPWSYLVIGVELMGIAVALHALMYVRSDRGTIAWCVGLVAMPFVTLPLYALFGRAKFARYGETIAAAASDYRHQVQPLADIVSPFEEPYDQTPGRLEAVLSKLSPFTFTRGNGLTLLINGEATFASICEAISQARHHVFLEFYIIRDDVLGNRLKELLVSRSREGIHICLLYDEIGSKDLSGDYLTALREAGVKTASFGPPLRHCDFFHINFRNHRKLVIVDGETAFVGGHNVGDEYLGRSKKFGDWRDTHVKVQGPAALDCQRIFLEDWYWATRTIPPLPHSYPPPPTVPQASEVLVLPTGPLKGADVCTLAYKCLINESTKRCWIASPYFVPSTSMLDALRGAALRGVDVRIMLPARPDHWIVHLASHSYLDALEEWQVSVYRYRAGFLHQKVILIDDRIAGVTSINLDQRSFHLNFEVGLFTTGSALVADVSSMLERDFADCQLVTAAEFRDRPLPFRLSVKLARLFSPVL